MLKTRDVVTLPREGDLSSGMRASLGTSCGEIASLSSISGGTSGEHLRGSPGERWDEGSPLSLTASSFVLPLRLLDLVSRLFQSPRRGKLVQQLDLRAARCIAPGFEALIVPV